MSTTAPTRCAIKIASEIHMGTANPLGWELDCSGMTVRYWSARPIADDSAVNCEGCVLTAEMDAVPDDGKPSDAENFGPAGAL